MAEMGTEPARSPFRLYIRLLPALGVATLVGSFIEADQRGLLFQSGDIALLAEDAALAVPNQPMGMYFGVGDMRDRGARGRDFVRRPPASRILAGIPADLGSDNAVGPAPGSSRTILEQPPREGQASPTIASATTTPAATQPGTGSFGPSFPDSPIGLIAVDTTTPGPVVPAVPEPASWLLMILGVGWLGLALRGRKSRDPWGSAEAKLAI